MSKCIIVVIVISFFIVFPVFSQGNDHSACFGAVKGNDTFSVGEVRTAILEEEDFQELNGPEWVLMDGRSVNEKAELTSHITHLKNERGEITIPDARGRFLRMANNGACSYLKEKEEEYAACLQKHNAEGDKSAAGDVNAEKPRPQQLGEFQGQEIEGHIHEYNDIYFAGYSYDPIDIKEDGKGNNLGTGKADDDNNGRGWDRNTQLTGGAETRPNNVIVNYFMKICLCRTEKCK